MPVYEYECKHCGEFEVIQRITEPALTKCPHLLLVGDKEVECPYPIKRLISLTAGHVMEPNGQYVPLTGLDAHGKTREEKVSPRIASKMDFELRNRMLATRDRAKKAGLSPVQVR